MVSAGRAELRDRGRRSQTISLRWQRGRAPRIIAAMRWFCLAALLFACDDGDPDVAPEPDAALVDATAIDAAIIDAAPIDADMIDPVDATPIDAAPDAAPPIGGPDRSARVFAPTGDPPAEGWPIALVLHGFRSNPELTIGQFPFGRTADTHGWIVVYPRGLPDDDGFLHWDDFGRVPEGPGDDVTHLIEVIDAVVARHGGDASRVLIIGHSNGGAMAQHMACHAPERIVAFVNLSGGNVESDRCAPTRWVTGVWAHGTEDDAVAYAGSETRPGVEEASQRWADWVGCDAFEDADPVVGYTNTPPDAPTAIRRWTGCPDGVQVERWRMEGVPHVLITTDAFTAAVRALVP